MPVKVRHSITQQFVVHLVRIESLCKSSCYSGHVLEEASPILVCKLVKLFLMILQSDEGVASEVLVRVQLSHRSAGFKEDQMRGFP